MKKSVSAPVVDDLWDWYCSLVQIGKRIDGLKKKKKHSEDVKTQLVELIAEYNEIFDSFHPVDSPIAPVVEIDVLPSNRLASHGDPDSYSYDEVDYFDPDYVDSEKIPDSELIAH